MRESFIFSEFLEDLELFILGELFNRKVFKLLHEPLLLLVAGEVHGLEANVATINLFQSGLDFPEGPLFLLVDEALLYISGTEISFEKIE